MPCPVSLLGNRVRLCGRCRHVGREVVAALDALGVAVVEGVQRVAHASFGHHRDVRAAHLREWDVGQLLESPAPVSLLLRVLGYCGRLEKKSWLLHGQLFHLLRSKD